jgi:hypothetical protein
MPILSEQLATRTKGPMAENEDWWRLCYDTDTKEFFVEHEWSYVKINGLKTNSGKSKHDVDTWGGEGAEAIERAKERLLERANG